MSKVVNGVFKWSDGEITAAAIREDMFERAGVELLAEVIKTPGVGFDFSEVVKMAMCFKDYPEDVIHTTAEEAKKILNDCWVLDMLADNVIKVTMTIHGMKKHFDREVSNTFLMYFILTEGTYWDAYPF